MRVTVHFVDGERIDGASEAMTLSKLGFPIVPDASNNELVWVSLTAIKYVLVHAGNIQTAEEGDPRVAYDLPKVVIRFHDGEVIRTYRDESWGQEAEGFRLRIWDAKQRRLMPALVSLHAVKGIFFVKEWDSRTAEEKLVRKSGAASNGHQAQAKVEALPPPTEPDGELHALARSYRARLARIRDVKLVSGNPAEFATAVRQNTVRLLVEDGRTLSIEQHEHLNALILRNAFGYGPLDGLLLDQSVTEIMVNGAQDIFVEREGRLQRAKQTFHSDQQLLEVIRKMIASIGRRIDESTPMVDGRLPDGSRINAVIPPAAVDSPTLTIRKFQALLNSLAALVNEGTLSPNMAAFLHHATLGRANLLISGGTGSGKTTTLNVLGSLIPETQRVVTIEDTAELQLQHPHVVRLEYRPPNVEGRGELNIRQLLRNSLRMRPDRIIVGEARGAEALEILQAMNTGHDGSMSTIHANSARDALARLETMVLSASIDLPLEAVRAQIGSALDLVLHQVRRPDGDRKMTQISEIVGYQGDRPVLRDIFRYDPVDGRFKATGTRPECLAKLEFYGVQCPLKLFEPDAATPPPAMSEANIPALGLVPM
jgi:pilus assembly protein CpaF